VTDASVPTDRADTIKAAATGPAATAAELAAALHLAVAPVGIGFRGAVPEDMAAFDAPMSDPEPDGRQGRVPAGCVFWVRGVQRTFATVPEDHGNCSVGSYTHGMLSLEEAVGHSDVGALLESGWITPEAASAVPHVATRPAAVVYGPVSEAEELPDVVLLRVNGRQLMVLHDAVGDLRIEGKPQCHIVALAKEQGVVAASVGCALSRARTGMRPEEMTCAIPGARLGEVTAAVVATAGTDQVVARYAATDARRFA
jgi:uncharacterized protein (DUF169 family)